MIQKSKILNISVGSEIANKPETSCITPRIIDSDLQHNDEASRIVEGLYEAYSLSVPRTSKITDGSFNNSTLKLGVSDVALSSAEYLCDMITFQRMAITNIYHGSWIFRRIIDKVAQDMWRAGITIEGETEPESLKRVYKRLSRLRSELIWVTQQARLYGGAASLIMVNDGTDSLEKPLNLSNIKKGSSIQLWSTDRWFGLSTSSEMVTNYKSRDFNTPEYYTFYIDQATAAGVGTIKVHHSRVLRFVNRKSVRLINTKLNGWGISELEHIFQDLMIHENAKNSAGSLVEKALLEIVYVEGMRGMMQGISTGSTAQQAALTGQLASLQNFRTNNLVLMDKQNEYQQFQHNFSGLSDLLETQRDIMAGAAEMPKVLLYGDTKGGLTSDSPAEMEFYASTIAGKQDEMLRPVLDKLLPILFAIEGIELPKDLDYDFESIAGVSQSKQLELLQGTINAINSLVDSGVLTHVTALKEIQQIQKQTGFGSNISNEDEKLAQQSDIPENEESDGELTEELPPVMDEYAEVKDQLIGKRRLFDKLRRN